MNWDTDEEHTTLQSSVSRDCCTVASCCGRCSCHPTTTGVLLRLTRDAAADMIYHSVLVCVLMSLNYFLRITDQSYPHPSNSTSPPTRPALKRNLSFFLYISPVSYRPSVLYFASISPSLYFICVAGVVIPFLPSLPVLYSSLY